MFCICLVVVISDKTDQRELKREHVRDNYHYFIISKTHQHQREREFSPSRWYEFLAFLAMVTQETRGIDPILVKCWDSVVDGGPTLNQYWVHASCLLGN